MSAATKLTNRNHVIQLQQPRIGGVDQTTIRKTTISKEWSTRMNSTTKIVGGLVAMGLLIGAGFFAMDGEEPNTTKSAETGDLREPLFKDIQLAPPRETDQPVVVANAQDTDAKPKPSPTREKPKKYTDADYNAHFYRERKFEYVCEGTFTAPLPDGTTVSGPNCWHEDRNPSRLLGHSTKSLIADIEAGQPWAAEAMEVLGMRYFANGYVHTGAGWLKEHAARTGKVGLLHLVSLQYLSNEVDHEVLRYEIFGILVGAGYPDYEQRLVNRHRASLIRGGVDPATLDAIDESVATFIANLPANDAVGDGGAS